MNVSLTVWAVTVGLIALLLIVDLFTVSSKPHEVKFKEAAGWSVFYIGIAVAFGIWVFQRYGSQSGPTCSFLKFHLVGFRTNGK